MNIQERINVPYLKTQKSGKGLFKEDRCIPHTNITIHTIEEYQDRVCVVHASFEAIVDLIAMMRNVCVDNHLLAGDDGATRG